MTPDIRIRQHTRNDHHTYAVHSDNPDAKITTTNNSNNSLHSGVSDAPRLRRARDERESDSWRSKHVASPEGPRLKSPSLPKPQRPYLRLRIERKASLITLRVESAQSLLATWLLTCSSVCIKGERATQNTPTTWRFSLGCWGEDRGVVDRPTRRHTIDKTPDVLPCTARYMWKQQGH